MGKKNHLLKVNHEKKVRTLEQQIAILDLKYVELTSRLQTIMINLLQDSVIQKEQENETVVTTS